MTAYPNNNNNTPRLVKQAGPYLDYAASMLYPRILPKIGKPANLIGSVHGMASGAVTEDDERAMDKNPGEALIPGVGASRVQRRLRRQLASDDGSDSRYWSTTLGKYTAGFLPVLAGSIIGAANADKNQREAGALKGAGAGAAITLLATAVAAAGALISPTRSKEEQAREAEGSTGQTVADYLLPGHAAYNEFKSYGRSIADSNQREKEDKDNNMNKLTKDASVHAREQLGMRLLTKVASGDKSARTLITCVELNKIATAGNNATGGSLWDSIKTHFNDPENLKRWGIGGAAALLPWLFPGNRKRTGGARTAASILLGILGGWKGADLYNHVSGWFNGNKGDDADYINPNEIDLDVMAEAEKSPKPQTQANQPKNTPDAVTRAVVAEGVSHSPSVNENKPRTAKQPNRTTANPVDNSAEFNGV